jgi:NAD-dependent dihydropyrimidine dehydrogenase PreA subunit
MPQVTIDEKGCRDCALCVEICPTEVFSRDERRELAQVTKPEDCIGCTSCLTVSDYTPQRPFYRIEENAALVARFLQDKPLSVELSPADYQEALGDVHVRLKALGDAVLETMGRGQRAVGRAAGALAAAHVPEMYEESTLADVLERMKKRFSGSFDFEATSTADGGEVTLRFPSCAFRSAVTSQGDKIGAAVLCSLFHEYWAGLLGAFTHRNYSVEMLDTTAECTMRLAVR